LCVVGDPDQSIYAWRGADLRNILDFEQDYPSATVIRLERNYRSTAVILKLADALIANNTQRKDKKLVAHIEGGDKAELYICQDEQDEADQITKRLQEFHGDGIGWSDMAIFYRMNSLSRVMEMALRREGVPYQIARGTEFYNRKEIKDVLAYLRTIANPRDEVSLDRIINQPTRGIGKTTLASVQAWSTAKGLTMWEGLAAVEQCDTISARAKAAITKFVKQVERWRGLANVQVTPDEAGHAADDLGMFEGAGDDSLINMGTGPVTPVVEAVIKESGLEAHYKKVGGDEQAELDNLAEFVTAAVQYDEEQGTSDNPLDDDAFGLGDFLNTIALVSDTDRMDEAGGAVTLMTLHAAKGLEFPVVAMIGLEEGLLPHSRAREDPAQLEEERRLAFVGITRAQQRLLLSRANYRTVRGMRDRAVASPFLGELPPDQIETTDNTGLSGLGDSRDEQRYAMNTKGDRLAGKYVKGQRVKHVAFGLGTVLDVSGGSMAKLVIDFDAVGQKTLLLEYAGPKLSPV
ncbi:MAG: 3'-5' exonuclease, partial [Planctomycetota bacterium]